MIMADILMWFLLIVGILIVFISYWLATQALMPGYTVEYAHRLQKHPLTSLLIGGVIVAPTVLFGLALFAVPFPAAQLMAVVTLLFPILIGLVGSTGLCALIGSGLNGAVDEFQPWRPVFRGGVVLGFTFLFPILGWFFVLPAVLTAGVGAVTRVTVASLFRLSGDRVVPNPQTSAVQV